LLVVILVFSFEEGSLSQVETVALPIEGEQLLQALKVEVRSFRGYQKWYSIILIAFDYSF
jgi:hypothetical protein